MRGRQKAKGNSAQSQGKLGKHKQKCQRGHRMPQGVLLEQPNAYNLPLSQTPSGLAIKTATFVLQSPCPSKVLRYLHGRR